MPILCWLVVSSELQWQSGGSGDPCGSPGPELAPVLLPESACSIPIFKIFCKE